jgi:hypothetical protein
MAIVIGANPNARLEKYVRAISEHFINDHAEHDRALQIKALEFLGMLRLRNYKTIDPGLVEQRDFLRWTIHQATLNASISDETIKAEGAKFANKLIDEICAQCGIKEPPGLAQRGMVARDLIELLTGFRNELQEPGRYKIEDPAQAPNGVVLPS